MNVATTLVVTVLVALSLLLYWWRCPRLLLNVKYAKVKGHVTPQMPAFRLNLMELRYEYNG